MADQTPHTGYAIHHLESPGFQMFLILLGVFMAILDTSVVQVAIPTMEAQLGASTDQIQWVLTGYILVIGIMVPLSGWLTDRFGAKQVFLFAVATFTVGSALSGLAWNLGALIVFRVIQAVGGGLMMPVAMAMIYMIFPPERRGMAMGLFGIVIMAAPAFGPLLSGYFVQEASWRLIFYINVPIGIITSLLGWQRLYNFPHQLKASLDVPGLVLSMTGFFALLYGFSNVSQWGWTNWRVEPFIAVGTVLLIALFVVEWRTPHPLIQFRVFKSYMFSMSVGITSIVQIVLYVGLFLMLLFLQNIMGYTPLQTGEFVTPAAFASAIMMLIGGRLFNRLGARILGLAGLLFMTGANYGFSFLTTDSSSTFIQTLYILRSIGMGLAMMPITTAGMNTLPLDLISQGSAISNAFRQVAVSLGTAIFTNFLTQKNTIHLDNLAMRVAPGTPGGIQIAVLQQQLAGQGMSLAAAHSEAIVLVYESIQSKAFVAALQDTFWITTLLSALAVITIVFFDSAEERAVRRRFRQGSGSQPTVVME